MCKEDKNKEIIRIVLNKRHDIQYASIDNQNAIKYLEKLGDLYRLTDNFPIEYDLEDYNVTIDEVNITGNMYYVITAVLRHPKCKNCRKALTDAVTGLYNRNYWEQIISGATFQPRTQNFSLILIDVDNLKEINDTYGHMAGDKAIEIVGQAIKNSIRKEDVGLRYGGDEFIILFFNQDKKAAYRVIERIRKEISELAAEQGMNIQISAGAAYYDCLRNMGDIIKMADRDLYKEKRIKKFKEEQSSKKLKDLLKEIERLRDELNQKVAQSDKEINNEEMLKLSQKLDELIIKGLKDEE
jgi:diguanylate cyclase (GGDEF)-like protein